MTADDELSAAETEEECDDSDWWDLQSQLDTIRARLDALEDMGTIHVRLDALETFFHE